MEFKTPDGRMIFILPSEIKAVQEIEIMRKTGMAGTNITEWGSRIVTKTDLSFEVTDRYSAVILALKSALKQEMGGG